MSSLFTHVIKLTCAVWPIALNCSDFVDPILMNHTLKLCSDASQSFYELAVFSVSVYFRANMCYSTRMDKTADWMDSKF